MDDGDKKIKNWGVKVICKLCFYILILLMLGSVLFWLCLKSMLEYSKWPIYTETNIVAQNEAQFPSMTFCAMSNGYKANILRVISNSFRN